MLDCVNYWLYRVRDYSAHEFQHHQLGPFRFSAVESKDIRNPAVEALRYHLKVEHNCNRRKSATERIDMREFLGRDFLNECLYMARDR